MPGQLVKIRPVENVKVISREFHTEMFMHGLGIFNELFLVLACVFFFEFMPKKLYISGILMWIIGCIVGCVVSGYHMWEYNTAKSRYKGEVRHEMMELVLYMISHVTYVIGCVLFLPCLYKTQTALMVGHALGTWFWIWGSVALVIAGHWNAIGFIEMATKLPPCRRTILIRRCASVALTCTAIGASLFFAGSFLFRPGFNNRCESPEAFIPVASEDPSEVIKHVRSRRQFEHMIQPDFLPILPKTMIRKLRGGPLTVEDKIRETPGPSGYELNPFCVSIIEQGTLLYLIGCIAFLLHSILSTACSVLLHRIRIEDAKLAYAEVYRRPAKLKAADCGGIAETPAAEPETSDCGPARRPSSGRSEGEPTARAESEPPAMPAKLGSPT